MTQMLRSLSELVTRSKDPVYHCEVYRDRETGGCVHVDGPGCEMETCTILKEYLNKDKQVIISSKDTEYKNPISVTVNKGRDNITICQGASTVTINQSMAEQMFQLIFNK